MVAGVLLGVHHDVALHELDRLRVQAGELDAGDGCDGRVDVGEGQDEARGRLGARDELERDLGDDRERTLRPDDQVQQAVARARLGDRAAELHHLARRQHDRRREHVIARGAVFDRAHAAGVGHHVAADRAGLLARIGRIEHPLCRHVIDQVAQAHARLHADGEVVLVVFQDLVHAHRAQHHAAVKRHAAAHQPGARAAHGHGDVVLAAQRHDRRHLLGGGGQAHRRGGVRAVDGHLVMGVILADGVAGEAVVGADDLLEPTDQVRVQFAVRGHGDLLGCVPGRSDGPRPPTRICAPPIIP